MARSAKTCLLMLPLLGRLEVESGFSGAMSLQLQQQSVLLRRQQGAVSDGFLREHHKKSKQQD
eukprot:6470948-Amphidinium_carterae.2